MPGEQPGQTGKKPLCYSPQHSAHQPQGSSAPPGLAGTSAPPAGAASGAGRVRRARSRGAATRPPKHRVPGTAPRRAAATAAPERWPNEPGNSILSSPLEGRGRRSAAAGEAAPGPGAADPALGPAGRAAPSVPSASGADRNAA